MTLPLNRMRRTDAEVLEDLSITRVLAVDELRRCSEPGCGKFLSRYNRHRCKCFFHRLTPAERELRREQPTGFPVCGSRETRGFNRVQHEYYGWVE